MHIPTMTRLLALAGSSILLLSACASSGAPGSVSRVELVGTWVTGETYPSPNEPFLTITEDGTWTGSDGCNDVQGTWSLEPGGTLTTEAGPSTLMYCGGAALPTFMANAKTAVINDGALTLFGEDGKSLVELMEGTAPAPTAVPDDDVPDDAVPFVGRWAQMEGAEAYGERQPYLELSKDGKVSGTDGCNRLMGSWAFDSSRITLEPLASTRMACEGVETWLAAAASATLEGDTLTVVDADGKPIGSLGRS